MCLFRNKAWRIFKKYLKPVYNPKVKESGVPLSLGKILHYCLTIEPFNWEYKKRASCLTLSVSYDQVSVLTGTYNLLFLWVVLNGTEISTSLVTTVCVAMQLVRLRDALPLCRRVIPGVKLWVNKGFDFIHRV